MQITRASFYDLTAGVDEARPSSVIKERRRTTAAVKDEPLDFTVFDRYAPLD